MAQLVEIAKGQHVEGVIAGAAVEIVSAEMHGDDALTVVFRTPGGGLDERVLTREDEPSLTLFGPAGRRFDGDAAEFKLAAEAQRIRLAGLYDPMLAVTTSEIQPLPHQLKAVYGELLPRTPLRFLLADDPGAGKTIMAGLYIKELMLREDVQRCLIVAPGGLVEQWQDELYLKFGLRFEIFNSAANDTVFGGSAFEDNPFLIARMDQLARNEELLEELGRAEWDLVVVDEAHRMGAHYFSGKLEKTKRFQLGEILGLVTRHLLLMTATPHSGKEDDFQLFLTLLDRDRYEGRSSKNPQKADTEGIMRRMVKEDLLTFDGKPLFPDRFAKTIPYELSEAEHDLYEEVTSYVREGMNRAKNLDGKRRNTVGFALTVLQRRLASSPEAIYRSLVRRSERLTDWKKRLESGEGVIDPTENLGIDPDAFDDEDFSAAELENLEEELVDAATAARTVEELDLELADLADLVEMARKVRALETDRKWSELRTIIEEETLSGSDGEPRKLIIFTEHRDTLEYLARRIRTMIGRPDSVVTIHGGVRRSDRRQITEEFTHNPDCRILLATDAAGEGLNLQVAHLMVNYDLPWNPNRIEQRFGRIHRIGQKYPCYLWNLIAVDTREGQVFIQLLEKIEKQRQAYGGKVFDVLGGAFAEKPLRDLLIEAIMEGEKPEVQERMERVIDERVSDGIRELLEEQSLVTGNITPTELNELREQMDAARARRLQPHYIERAFRESFARLGGRMAPREKATFEIKNVPVEVRQGSRLPIATRYERITFELDRSDRAELIAPGNPLHDSVLDLTIEKAGGILERGTVLVSAEVEKPQLLVGLMEEVADGTGATVARRFSYAYVAEGGKVEDAGPAPYLDCVAAPETGPVKAIREADWLIEAEGEAMNWLVAHKVNEFLTEEKGRRLKDLERTREQVKARLLHEQNRLVNEAAVSAEKAKQGKKVRESEASLMSKAADISQRMEKRLALIEKQEQIFAKPPRVVSAAMVLPVEMIDQSDETEEIAPLRAKDTKAVERRGVDLAMATERELGREPEEQAFNNPGFDILSRVKGELPIRVEVKARFEGAEDFYITHNEIMTGLNSRPRYRLAMVKVSPEGPEHDEIRYLDDPFDGYSSGGLATKAARADWKSEWAKAKKPF
ncbi:MAG TPA: helicase-related protein [Solirubrobacterales bacterium]|nr:helicase-related protein [Solirubrobacterales bacterium]